MAGAAIELDVSEVLNLSARLRAGMRELAEADQAQLQDEIGWEVESQTKERFDEQRDPDGAAWQPWSESYRERRAGDGGSILRRRGDLSESITHETEGAETEAGSAMVYAAVHQYGDDELGIPARPYLGISDRDSGELGMLVEDFLRAHGGLVE